MSDLFTYTEAVPPPDPISTPDGCIAVAVPGFLADGVTADADGIIWTPQSIAGFYDSIPVRSETGEMQPAGSTITVAQELGRDLDVRILAHGAPGLALGTALCFAARYTIKTAFRCVQVPITFRVVDPFSDRTILVRRVGPIRTEILGNAVAVLCTIPLLAEDPRRFTT